MNQSDTKSQKLKLTHMACLLRWRWQLAIMYPICG